MELQHERSAGMDISKRDAKVCVRTPGRRAGTFDKTVTVWGSTTREVERLRRFLLTEAVSIVVMEATGDYWKPFYYRLEFGLNVMLVNARYARNLPGRKTDVADSQWLAELGAYGLVRASFVPPEPIRELRDLTRTRTIFTREHSREVQRLEKLLEDSTISSIFSCGIEGMRPRPLRTRPNRASPSSANRARQFATEPAATDNSPAMAVFANPSAAISKAFARRTSRCAPDCDRATDSSTSRYDSDSIQGRYRTPHGRILSTQSSLICATHH
nr:hypothetical protein GCM10017611_06160 [Rhodococcus wratislaviensis]